MERQERELALDLEELEIELSDVVTHENGPEPLEEVAAAETGRDDAFDPAALIATDELPRPVDELDLPSMADESGTEHESRPLAYEFDLDEELADVLASQPALVDPLYDEPVDRDPAGGQELTPNRAVALTTRI
nr:hypothetical protein [Marinicella sp. W31]MDC2877520.1 hypothetical protein [Marinicella sp. W31]